MNESKNEIENRKKDHLKIVCDEDVNYQRLSTGFEDYHFIHNALPEIDLKDVDVSTDFLGYQLNLPLMITSMGGGENQGKSLNRGLAKAANSEKVALGLGSIRPALNNPKAISSYAIAREYAPDIPIVANLGAAQLSPSLASKNLSKLLKDIGVDAISIHLNPLQEALQPEGNTLFKGVGRAIEILIDTISLPIIVKEVGFGLSVNVVKRLQKIGIEWVDIAGAGGTSWARIEEKRIKNKFYKKVAKEFFEWGIPTLQSLIDSVKIKGVKVIASGGIDTGLKFSKAIALGASLGGAAAPFLRVWRENDVEGIQELISIFKEALRLSLFCTGTKDIGSFKGNTSIIERSGN